jgi:Lar family restriction alleviation protein
MSTDDKEQTGATGAAVEAFNAAIDFALGDDLHDYGLLFLEMWREGRWDEIAEEFPEFKGPFPSSALSSNAPMKDERGLLPCPFCGQPPTVSERADDHSPTKHVWFIACYCGGYSARAHQFGHSPDEVTDKWNARSVLSASAPSEAAKWKAAYERANAEVFRLADLLRKADPNWSTPLHVNQGAIDRSAKP